MWKKLNLEELHKLRNKEYQNDIQRIYITPDVTLKEQKESKALRNKLAELNQTGKNFKIKKQTDCAEGQLAASRTTDQVYDYNNISDSKSYEVIVVNCQNIKSKKDPFSNLLSTHNPDFLLVQNLGWRITLGIMKFFLQDIQSTEETALMVMEVFSLAVIVLLDVSVSTLKLILKLSPAR